ncbi:1-phosphatidylinositol-3-phosphate 5-kinase NDAI_0H03600 [Naumovozyma dairenensis CBS 421]|uniref:1-phosphatidylinositol-3-phosphate 5-kinase n=1 Tax=Naumovozyma dairenensis (strain ATCC 10597 / BCRC 20456 / CBS 421 / NBRC 0211 / NRRL Y-12639) TaxID=1071378 RepID=G0WFH2_NAUDC|nr:hypothetical protein NDAI_0H03600 [Naumovozyma dairenensis CBS 421]CCD26533.1 hypothetical protein NDAI_0H03600 [Naumovozyma dairenensis CBS 421]
MDNNNNNTISNNETANSSELSSTLTQQINGNVTMKDISSINTNNNNNNNYDLPLNNIIQKPTTTTTTKPILIKENAPTIVTTTPITTIPSVTTTATNVTIPNNTSTNLQNISNDGDNNVNNDKDPSSSIILPQQHNILKSVESQQHLLNNSKKSLTFSVNNNDANIKRSSIYKSNVNPIPIRHKSNTRLDNSDLLSTKSRSSSMTTSLSKSFLFGFYHNNKRKKKLINQENKKNGIISKQYWMKDESVNDCYDCGKPFSTFRRKHHCRICGQIFCHYCTLLIDGKRFGFNDLNTLRVCDHCFQNIDNFIDSSDDEEDDDDEVEEDGEQEEEYEQSQENLSENNHRSFNPAKYYSNGNKSEDAVSLLQNSQHGDHNNNNNKAEVLLFNDNDVQSIITSGEDSKLFITTPPPPPKMAIPATRHGESLEISPHLPMIDSNHNQRAGYLSPPHIYHRKSSNHSLRRTSFSQYNKNRNNNIFNDFKNNSSSNNLKERLLNRKNKTISFTDTLNHKLANRNFKFNFHYHPQNNNNNNNNNDNVNNSNKNTAAQANNNTNDNKYHHPRRHSVISNRGNNNPLSSNFPSGIFTSPTNNNNSNRHISEQYGQIDNDSSEDEDSMSIYSSLNDIPHSDNPIRSIRNSNKSLQRAQASLQRIQNRRKSRSRTHVSKSSDSLTRIRNLLSHSTSSLYSPEKGTQPTSRSQLAQLALEANHSDGSTVSTSFPTPSGSETIMTNLTSNQRGKIKKDFNINNESGSNSNSNVNISSSAWRRISGISGMKNYKENKTELNEVSTLHLEALLEQVLSDQNIDDPQPWLRLLRNFMKKIQYIKLDARDTPNSLDYRQTYVKIKRISGGKIEASDFINGIVFSKSLPCKSMPRYLNNPRILLIMFPIEYQKNKTHFLSLQSVMAQENEYLAKLVTRLTALNPDIIFVGAEVSRYALKLLDEAGIIVQFNMKPQIIERIAKLTEADIATSLDKLSSNFKLGKCGSFEVKTYIYQENISKTYTFLTGCDPSLGGTILLRGDTQEILRKIKQVSEFMVYSVFSLKLESSFFNDNFIQLSSQFYQENRIHKQNDPVEGYFADFLVKFNKRILTVSPTVQFPIPFLLLRARELEEQLHKKMNESLDLDTVGDITRTDSLLGIESTLTMKDLKYVTKFIKESEIEDLKSQFEKRSRQWELSYSLSHNLLGTGSHQCITVLYSMVSTRTATPCIGPQIVTIDYFWDSDISLGQFIENVVSTAWYPCLQGCKGLLMDHYRSYVHGSGKVDVLIEKFQTKLPKLKDIILSWSYCKKCGTSTPILQLSQKTSNHSLGKYLEVMFWSNKDSVEGIGACMHDFTKDHVKYFGYNDLVVRMEYSDLEVHELITPPRKLKWMPHKDIKLKIELYYQILDKINGFYDSVLNRLDRVKLDSVSDEKIIAGQAEISDLHTKVNIEKKSLLEMLEQVYEETKGDQHLSLNMIIRTLYMKAVSWDSAFNAFGKEYLPSENDVTRITTKQLKKLFSDNSSQKNEKLIKDQSEELNSEKQSSEHSQDNVSLHESRSSLIKMRNSAQQEFSGDNEDQVQIKDAEKTESNKDNERVHVASTSNGADSFEINVLNPIGDRPTVNRFKSSSVFEPHSKVKNVPDPKRVSIGSNLSSLSTVGKDHNMDTKVGQLASFFDQMHLDAISKEFELQREKERLQLNKYKYQALRLQTSSPIVEIYQDVNDAVDEPLHDSSETTSRLIKGTEHPASLKKTNKSSSEPILTHHDYNPNLEEKLEHSINQWGVDAKGKEITTANDNLPSIEPPKATTDDKLKREQLQQVNAAKVAESTESTSVTQPEKSLLMKALTNFWADRSPYLWKPLVYPSCPTEHVFADSDVIVREDEPTSLIAFCLNTSDYKQKMLNINANTFSTVNSDIPASIITKDTSLTAHDLSTAGSELENASTTSMRENYGGRPSNDPVSVNHQSTSIGPTSELEKSMTKKTAVHLRYQFEEGATVMSCKLFFTEHFEAFRKVCGCQENFIQSLSRCVKWDSSGGKSGSGFLKTLDDRFIIKELSHSELDAFIKFAPYYFEYMAQAMFHDLPTTLAKVLGFYQIQVRNPVGGPKSYKMDVIIMENLFYNRKTTRIFDLKGSMRNRHVEQTGKENEVLLDENMVEYIYESPIHVREYDKKLLRASLWNDTLFLAKMNVMDYSLVIGIDNEGYTLTVGIIDFIRTFTWDKKLESWVKEKGLVGGGGSSTKKPTVVTPRQYKNRFREAMENYILMVPDPWYQDNV